jgi:hypothetical protein
MKREGVVQRVVDRLSGNAEPPGLDPTIWPSVVASIVKNQAFLQEI